MPPINDSEARRVLRQRFDFLSECADVSPDDACRVRSVVIDGDFLRGTFLGLPIPGVAEHGIELVAGLLRAAVPAKTIIHDWDGQIFRLRYTMQAAFDSYYIVLSNPEWDAVESGGVYPAYQLQVTQKEEGDKVAISVCLQQFPQS
jgi:hypothetical protein